jgi:hypothetical protein
MNFEEALRAELGTIEGLQNKVFPLNAPEGTKTPFMIYVSSEGIQDKTLQGYLNSKEVDCEIYILADSYTELKRVIKEVLLKITSFPGRVIGDDGPYIQNVTYTPPVELYEQAIKLYRCAFDLKLGL